MPARCSICAREMVTMPVTTGGGLAMAVSICRVCDRRRCTMCNHSEQDVYARRCSNCGQVCRPGTLVWHELYDHAGDRR